MGFDTAGFIGIGIALVALTAMGAYISYRLCTKRGRASQSDSHKQYLADVEARAGKETYKPRHASSPLHRHSRASPVVDSSPNRTNLGASRAFQNGPPKPVTGQGSQTTRKTTTVAQTVRRTPPKGAANGHRTSKGEVDIWRLRSSVLLTLVEPAGRRLDHSKPGDILLEPRQGGRHVEQCWI